MEKDIFQYIRLPKDIEADLKHVQKQGQPQLVWADFLHSKGFFLISDLSLSSFILKSFPLSYH